MNSATKRFPVSDPEAFLYFWRIRKNKKVDYLG